MNYTTREELERDFYSINEYDIIVKLDEDFLGLDPNEGQSYLNDIDKYLSEIGRSLRNRTFVESLRTIRREFMQFWRIVESAKPGEKALEFNWEGALIKKYFFKVLVKNDDRRAYLTNLRNSLVQDPHIVSKRRNEMRELLEDLQASILENESKRFEEEVGVTHILWQKYREYGLSDKFEDFVHITDKGGTFIFGLDSHGHEVNDYTVAHLLIILERFGILKKPLDEYSIQSKSKGDNKQKSWIDIQPNYKKYIMGYKGDKIKKKLENITVEIKNIIFPTK